MPGHFVNGVKSAIQEKAKKFLLQIEIAVDSTVPKEKKGQGNTVSG